MDYREYLARQLEEILEKRKEIIINDSLAKVCRELDSFTDKIKDSLSKNEDLPKQDKDRIQKLNDEYNANISKYKRLKGIK